jgi:hypothetical protein
MAILLWLLLCATLCPAQVNNKKPVQQARPDLSGTWELDRSKSDLKGYDRDLREGGITLVVAHHEPQMKVTRKFRSEGKDQTQKLLYYTDSRGEENPVLMGKGTVKSKTIWDGHRIVTKSIYRKPTSRGIMSIETLIKWELSSDGSALIQTLTHNLPWFNPSGAVYPILGYPNVEKRVFKRVP